MLKQTIPSPDRVVGLRCEGLESPRLVNCASPRFSWKMESPRRGAKQSSYQLRVGLAGATEALWDSGRVESPRSQWIQLEGLCLEARTPYCWQVRIWNEAGEASDWSEAGRFETGLLDGAWPADWISDGRTVAVKEAPAARYFRGGFELDERPARATLYLTALGVVEPWLNGRKVSEDLFAPGWPDYRKRVFYVSYDVTDLLQVGSNALGLVLGDAWYSSTLFLDHQYGPTPKLSAWLEIRDVQGGSRIVSTDSSWRWKTGPIVANGIYFGETYDARLEDPSWASAAPQGAGWSPVVGEPRPDVCVDPRLSPPVRRIEELQPIEVRRSDSGTWIYDLGQNMVGWARLKVKAEAGAEVTLRFAEMLNADGSLHTANLRSAQATARYTAKGGDAVEEWEPTFTFFGFRYVELIGVEEPLADAIAGVVVHTDLKRTGFFECSNPLLNKLFSNTLWGQKCNFLELPTDCPQRDERLGWTGDAQVFCHTALYNMDAGVFYRQWLAAVRDSFIPGPFDGGFACVAPYTGFMYGAAGWADGGAIVPWMTWLHTGDRALIEENFDAVCDWVELLRESAPEGIRISKDGWGDWLAPGYPQREAPTPYPMIATAYYAYSTQIAIWMAEELGRGEVASKYRALLAEVKAAFDREYIAEDGKIQSGEQTAYLLALSFDLVPEEKRAAMVEHLRTAIAVKNDHLSTGFIGTPLLAPTLSKFGLTELAYKVAQQETYPGWLYSVVNGATTIWERWDSWTPEGGFHPMGMNSFNHYAYGSIVGWFYETVAGIKIDPTCPGWQRFVIAPEPGGGLSHARATLETPLGEVISSWRKLENGWNFEIKVPANARARVVLPVAAADSVREGRSSLTELASVDGIHCADGLTRFELAAGHYHFRVG